MRQRSAHGSVALAATGLLVAACAPTSPRVRPSAEIPAFDGLDPSIAAALPAADTFLSTDDEMRRFVLARVGPDLGPQERIRRISSLLLGSGEFAIRYEADATRTASETFHARAGNCLSFAALVVALAREAGLEARFQNVPVLPNWHLSGTTFVVERHVDALLRTGGRDYVLDLQPPTAATYAEARPIDDAQAVAQYFGNLGVARFEAGDLQGAYSYFRRGLQVAPTDADLWVDIGVVLGRNSQGAAAEQVYRTALDIEPRSLSALNNLALLLQRRGNEAEARELLARIEDYRRGNPYYLFWRGDKQMQLGDFTAALEDFTAAARRMPREADFRFAMARAYLALGRYAEADRCYQEALDRASNPAVRAGFEERYRSLNRFR